MCLGYTLIKTVTSKSTLIKNDDSPPSITFSLTARAGFFVSFFKKKNKELYYTRLTHTAWEAIDARFAHAGTIQYIYLRIIVVFVGITPK